MTVVLFDGSRVPYGQAAVPRSPGTWQREVWWALNRAARIGGTAKRHRRAVPPFRYSDLLVTSGRPNMPYGRSTSGNGHLSHLPHTILFAWHPGNVLAGHMVAWHCGARTAYFRFLDEPDSPVCEMCRFRSRSAVRDA